MHAFPHFPLLVRPRSFSLSGAFFAHDIPHQNLLHFPHSSSLSGATFAAEFTSKAYGESFKQIIVLFAKIPYHLVQISAYPGVRLGRFLGGGREEI